MSLRKNKSLPLLDPRMSCNDFPIKCEIKNVFFDNEEINSLFQSTPDPLKIQHPWKSHLKQDSSMLTTKKTTTKNFIYTPQRDTFEKDMRRALGINAVKFQNSDVFPLISSRKFYIHKLPLKDQFYILKRELKYNDRHNMPFFLAKQDKVFPYSMKQIYAIRRHEENKTKDFVMYPGF